MRSPKNSQLDLFTPDDGHFEYAAVATNTALDLPALYAFICGRGAQEKTLAELKGDCGMSSAWKKTVTCGATGRQRWRAAASCFVDTASSAEEKLVAYDWPGNVRELANGIERAVVLGHEPTIPTHDLPPRIVAAQPKAPAGRLSYRASVDASRRELVLKALSQTGGNRAAAAKVLGIQRTYLYKLMKALGIE